MKALTIKPARGQKVVCRKSLIEKGYAVIFYPALWGGNAHPKNRQWCVNGKDVDIDYGSLKYLEKSMQKKGRKYVIIRTRR